MGRSLLDRLTRHINHWLTKDKPIQGYPMSNFERAKFELRPCDILLVEGRSRISEVIKQITQSPWSHSALYIGRIHDVENPILREELQKHFNGQPDTQLIIESMLGKGIIVSPVEVYADSHIRICRPHGISRGDAQKVIGFTIGRLGLDYDIRNILDLARFLFPWSFIPKRWRSCLFTHHAGTPTKQICSSLLAEAFGSVHFPVLPHIKKHGEKGLQLIRRLPRLYTPSDFDYSPYFDIIKYPYLEIEGQTMYRNLPWSEEDIYTDDQGEIVQTGKPQQKQSTATSTLTKKQEKHDQSS